MTADIPRGAARVALHRFRETAGLSVIGAEGTIYLDAKAARDMARDLARLARSLERESFGASSFRSEGFPAYADSGAAAQYAKAPAGRGQA